MSAKWWWPGVGQVSKEEYCVHLAEAKRLCGTEGQQPHSWTVPIVGDDTLVCGYCGEGIELVDPTASRQVGELLDHLDDGEAAQFAQAFRAAVDDARRRERQPIP